MAKFKEVIYVEPSNYFPKEIRERIFGQEDKNEISRKRFTSEETTNDKEKPET